MTTAPTSSSRTPSSAPSEVSTGSRARLDRLRRRFGVWLRYVMAVRVQVIAGGLMVVVLFLPRMGLWSVVGNVFVVRPVELGLAAFISLFGGWFIVQLLRVTWAGAPDRLAPHRTWDAASKTFEAQPLWLPFGADGWNTAWPQTREEWLRQWLPAGALAAGPVGLAAVHTWTERGADVSPLPDLVGPILFGFACFVAVVWLFSLYFRHGADKTMKVLKRVGWWVLGLLGSRLRSVAIGRGRSMFKRLGDWLRGWVGPGYFTADAVRTEQRFAVAMMGLLALIYVLTMWGMRPAASRLEGCVGGLCFPVIGYAVLVVMVLTAVLAGLTFFLDYWRVPTLALLLLTAVVFDRIVTQDYSYRVGPRTAEHLAAAPVGPREVVRAVSDRWQGRADRPTVITVTASGGGITSAAWTSRVLTGLEYCYGDAFARSVAVISGASGGSVGTMFYLAPKFPSAGTARDPGTLHAVRTAARRSGLRAVSWGIAFPDLLKVFQLRWLAAPLEPRTAHLDRAWSLEQSWLAAWDHDLAAAGAVLAGEPPMLDDWRARVRAEGLPVSIFGAMTVEDGRLLLLSTGALANGGGCKGYEGSSSPITTMDCLYPNRDVAVVTAARLSASFPWVSPNARALPDSGRLEQGEPAYHVIDGGVFDNSGSAAAALWLNEALAKDNAQPALQVLPIRIQWGDWQSEPPADDRGPRGTLTAVGMPINAMVSARTSTQQVANTRTDLLVREALVARQPGVTIHPDVVFNLGLPSRPPKATGDPAISQSGAYVPLSWQLSERQQAAIRTYWAENDRVRAAMTAVGKALGASPRGGSVEACLSWEGESGG